MVRDPGKLDENLAFRGQLVLNLNFDLTTPISKIKRANFRCKTPHASGDKKIILFQSDQLMEEDYELE